MDQQLTKDQSAGFMHANPTRRSQEDWSRAASVVDDISVAHASRFDQMSRAQIKEERLRVRGLL
jgi:hypothetical protein